jgi:phage terminase large subunit GpA-like protein
LAFRVADPSFSNTRDFCSSRDRLLKDNIFMPVKAVKRGVGIKTKSGVTSRLREVRKRADHVALGNKILRSNLVSYVDFFNILEKCMPPIRDYLCESVSPSTDLAENIDSWQDRLRAVAKVQASLHEKEEIEEEPSVPDIPEEGSALQRERARESKFRADLWTLRNQILRAELIDAGAIFRGLSGIFSTVVQMVKAGARNPIEILNTVSSWKLPKCEDKTSVDLARRLLTLCEPKPPISPSDWQEKYRIAPPGAVREGRWKNWCYQKDVLDAFADPEVSTITLCWASQLLGKTAILQGILGYAMAEEPCACLVVHPTHDQAMAWSKNAFGPMCENTPILSQMLDNTATKKGARSGYGENTVLHKKFSTGGWLLALGANSPAPLRAHSVRIVCLDEVDGYPDSAGSEGDVATLAMQRNIKFPNAKTILTSTPTIRHFSRIEKSLANSSEHRWHCTCPNPSCGNDHWVIAWKDIKWPKTKDNEGKTKHLVHLAELVCPQCDSRFNDVERKEIVNGGRWIATRPEIKGHRGYALNGFVVLDQVKAGFESWSHYFAQRFLDAKALGTNGLRTFSTLICAESYEISGSTTTGADVLYGRREKYPETPEGEMILPSDACCLVVGAADIQRSRIESGLLAYTPTQEIYWLQYERFYGDPKKPEIWETLHDFFARRWKHPSGWEFSATCCCLDSAESGDQVYAFCNKYNSRFFRMIPVRGEKGYEVEDWIRPSNTKSQLRLLRTASVKETIYRRLTIMQHGPEYIHFPSNRGSGFDRSFFEQLTSEVMRQETPDHSPTFVKPYSEARNESLDIFCYAQAASEIIVPSYPEIQQWLATPPPKETDWRRRTINGLGIPDLRGVPSPAMLEEEFRAILTKHPGIKKWCSL